VAVQLARETGAHIIGTGRASDRDLVGTLGVHEFLDLDGDRLEDAGEVDVVFDVIGGEIRDRSTALLRPGGTVVTVADPPTIQPHGGRAIFFVVEPSREQVAQLAARPRDGHCGDRIRRTQFAVHAPGSHRLSRPSATWLRPPPPS
jgi:NADPH:quinone reductase-like Zn-dependent oxidoreductase